MQIIILLIILINFSKLTDEQGVNAIIVHIIVHISLFRSPYLELKDYEFIIWVCPEGSKLFPKK